MILTELMRMRTMRRKKRTKRMIPHALVSSSLFFSSLSTLAMAVKQSSKGQFVSKANFLVLI